MHELRPGKAWHGHNLVEFVEAIETTMALCRNKHFFQQADQAALDAVRILSLELFECDVFTWHVLCCLNSASS